MHERDVLLERLATYDARTAHKQEFAATAAAREHARLARESDEVGVGVGVDVGVCLGVGVGLGVGLGVGVGHIRKSALLLLRASAGGWRVSVARWVGVCVWVWV